MRNVVLEELAKQWEAEAQPSQVGRSMAAVETDEDKLNDANGQGQRHAKRECADTLRTLMSMLKDAD